MRRVPLVCATNQFCASCTEPPMVPSESRFRSTPSLGNTYITCTWSPGTSSGRSAVALPWAGSGVGLDGDSAVPPHAAAIMKITAAVLTGVVDRISTVRSVAAAERGTRYDSPGTRAAPTCDPVPGLQRYYEAFSRGDLDGFLRVF